MADAKKMTCPDCGTEMNFHAEKIDYGTESPAGFPSDPDFGGPVEEFYTCPDCGRTDARYSGQSI